MILIPFERLTIHTQLDVEEALRRLESVVELCCTPDSQIQNQQGDSQSQVPPDCDPTYSQEPRRPYWGTIEGYHFKIQRNIVISPSKRGFPPPIEGDIRPEASGCSIAMTVYFRTPAIVFWVCLVGAPACLIFANSVYNLPLVWGRASNSSFEGLFQNIVLWLICCFILFWTGITGESVRTKSFFCSLFQTEPVNEVEIKDLTKKETWGGRDSSIGGSMILAPYERLTIHTHLSAEEALRRLESVVGPEPVDPDLERIAAIEKDWRKLINAEPYSSPESQVQSRPRSYRFPVPPRRDPIQPQAQARPYWGEIEGYHFKIHRIIRLRIRGWRPPALEGDIQPEVNGCSICATVRSDPAVMVVWAGIVIIFALSFVYGIASLVGSVVEAIWFGGQASYPSLSRLLFYFFQGLAACLVYSTVVWGGFKSESIKFKAFLRTLFQADHMDEFGIVGLIK